MSIFKLAIVVHIKVRFAGVAWRRAILFCLAKSPKNNKAELRTERQRVIPGIIFNKRLV